MFIKKFSILLICTSLSVGVVGCTKNKNEINQNTSVKSEKNEKDNQVNVEESKELEKENEIEEEKPKKIETSEDESGWVVPEIDLKSEEVNGIVSKLTKEEAIDLCLNKVYEKASLDGKENEKYEFEITDQDIKYAKAGSIFGYLIVISQANVEMYHRVLNGFLDVNTGNIYAYDYLGMYGPDSASEWINLEDIVMSIDVSNIQSTNVKTYSEEEARQKVLKVVNDGEELDSGKFEFLPENPWADSQDYYSFYYVDDGGGGSDSCYAVNKFDLSVIYMTSEGEVLERYK